MQSSGSSLFKTANGSVLTKLSDLLKRPLPSGSASIMYDYLGIMDLRICM